MGRLPEGAHELSCDEFPCAWACGAAGGVLGRVEEADLVLEAASSPGDEGCSREQRGAQMRGVLASPIPGHVRFAQANGGLLLDAPARVVHCLLNCPEDSLVVPAVAPALGPLWPPVVP